MTLDDDLDNPWPCATQRIRKFSELREGLEDRRARISGDPQAAAFDVVGPQPYVDHPGVPDLKGHYEEGLWVDPRGNSILVTGENLDPEQVTYTGNPKDAIGDTKPPLHLVPAALGIYASQAMANGAAKYGPYNWREKPVKAHVYVAAALRHLHAWYDGEDAAEDSGAHHLAHAAAGLAILLDAMATGNLIDDRPTPGPASRLIAEFTETRE